MAENSVRTPGSGESIRSIDKSAINTQVVVLDAGGTGAEALVSTSNPLPAHANTLDDTIVTGTAASLNADACAATDCRNLRAIALQVTGTWVGTLSFQGCNDNATWVSVLLQQSATANAAPVATTTANGLFVGVTGYRYFRARMTAYTSGSAVGTTLLSQTAIPPNTVGGLVAATQSGTWNVGTVGAMTPGTAATNLGKAEDAAAATGDIGVAVWAVRRDTPSTSVSAAGDYSEFIVNATGALYVQPTPNTVGGLTPTRVMSAAGTNSTLVKASAGQIYSVIATNINAAVRYLKIYNAASAPTAGTGTPILTIPIPGNAAGAGIVIDTGGLGIAFATGIGLTITTGAPDADTGATALNDVIVTVLWR